MTLAIEQSITEDEFCRALGISRRQVSDLIRAGLLGYSKGQRNTRRFFAEHVAQARAALAVQPKKLAATTDLSIPGTTMRGASRRRA